VGELLIPSGRTQRAALRNRILAGLSREKYSNLFSALRPVTLNEQEILYHVDDTINSAYFINSGMASLMSITNEGNSIEVANIGNEGVIGIPVLLRQDRTPHQIVVQVSGDAFVVSVDILKQEFEREGELKEQLLCYTHALATYMSQLGVCNHFHTVDKRLSRWLLLSSYQVQSLSFHLTHESFSQVLGTGRTGVTMAVNRLQRLGLIESSRGQITLLDRAGLEAISCDCYKITTEVFENYLGLNHQT
jgi:CRP-like cAMP-binding protein